MKNAQYFSQRECRGRHADEGRADRFPCKHRHPALIETARLEIIVRSARGGATVMPVGRPQLAWILCSWKRVNPYGAKVVRAAAESRLHDQAESDLAQRTASERVIQAAECDLRVIGQDS